MSLSNARLNSLLQAGGGSLGHDVWRANQMGSYRSTIIKSGFPALDKELPGGGWPASALIELLLQQHGIGELRLLRLALKAVGQKRAVVLIDPPYMPNAAAWSEWGLSADQLLLIRPRRTADALWSAEQVLRNGSCGALLFWQPQVRDEALRRLQLAAQGSDTMCWLLRPSIAAQNSSPSPLRLALKPVAGGISVHVVKRRGPQHEQPFTIVLDEERARVASEPTSVRALVQAPAKPQAAASSVAALHSA